MDNEENELNEIINSLQTCPKCKAITNGEKYCHNCGEKLIEDGLAREGESCKPYETKISNGMHENTKLEEQNKKIIAAIIAIVISIIGIYLIIYTINDINNDYNNSMKELESFQKDVISFNCPYCNKWLSIDKEDFLEISNSYIYRCPNCRKQLTIDKDTMIVTYK